MLRYSLFSFWGNHRQSRNETYARISVFKRHLYDCTTASGNDSYCLSPMPSIMMPYKFHISQLGLELVKIDNCGLCIPDSDFYLFRLVLPFQFGE